MPKMSDLLTLENIVVLLAAAGSFITILGIGMSLVSRDQLASRMKAVAARREELSRQQKAKFQQRMRLQPKAHVGAMRALLEKLKLENLIGSKETRNRMAQAGWRSPSAPVTFAFTRVATPVVLMVAVLLFTGPLSFEGIFALGGALGRADAGSWPAALVRAPQSVKAPESLHLQIRRCGRCHRARHPFRPAGRRVPEHHRARDARARGA